MKRNILLVEPNYCNKYPPIGLMKIASYHRLLGDSVTFYKGDIRDFIIGQICQECVMKLSEVDSAIAWKSRESKIRSYIKTRRMKDFDAAIEGSDSNKPLLSAWLKHYARYYKSKRYHDEPKWDRIYVTTLFTFYWKITVETIEAVKPLVKNTSELKIGGVMASLLTKEIEEETGITPMSGLLDRPGLLDDNDYVIDDLPLDYSILDEIDYRYPTGSAFFTYMTKGCTRKCKFCSVPKLEPIYKPKIETIDKFSVIREKYGEQQNLLLMDNNVLASPKFPEIVADIKKMGFEKGATYVEPNQLEISIRNLKDGSNDRAYVSRCYRLVHELLGERLKGDVAQKYYNVLDRHNLLKRETTAKEGLLEAYPYIADTYERFRNKSKKARYVDFNQGVDARYVTEDLMKLMSEIAIRPLRIAFDYIGMEKQYVYAVELAAKYGIKELSNYLLYNFVDKPEDLYRRMAINIDLREKHDIHIYSFPMKFIPLFGEDAKHRNYVGKHWNRKYIRAIQSVLNATKGIVADGRSFFEKAFGKDLDGYFEILYMPEVYIVYRKVFEEIGYTGEWRESFYNLSEKELAHAKKIIELNDFKDIEKKTKNTKIRQLLRHYSIKREDVKREDTERKQLKAKYDKLIRKDRFVDLTLTYDHDDPTSE